MLSPRLALEVRHLETQKALAVGAKPFAETPAEMLRAFALCRPARRSAAWDGKICFLAIQSPMKTGDSAPGDSSPARLDAFALIT